jgi:hypothetical protein
MLWNKITSCRFKKDFGLYKKKKDFHEDAWKKEKVC